MKEGTRTPDTPEQQRRHWARLVAALRPRATLTQLIVGLLCLLLGLSIVMQVRQHDEDSLESASQEELVRLLDESGRHVADLEAENAELDRTLETLQSGHEDDVAAQNAAQERLTDLEILAGTSPAQGRGVSITITDPAGSVRAPTVLGVIQELRNAGAEVIQVGEVRVVASSSVTSLPAGGVAVDGQEVPSPMMVLAIGDPSVMEPALKIPGGAADSVAADGGAFSVTAQEEVRIDAVAELAEPEYSEVVK